MSTGPLTASLPADSPDEVDPPPSTGVPWAEIGVAVLAFVAFCVVVLLKKAQLMEPDDYAYRASIVALSEGHLALTTAQYHALAHQVGGIQQWVQLPNGRWMSEKNPGYPFFAVLFQWLHALRLAPLFAGGLASTSLFIAARRWLGRWAGTFAVIFFLASGMALAFASRSTMPTFTDASFIAAGAGAVLWAMLSTKAAPRRRTWVGLLGFMSLELATFMRYTDVVMLLVACAAVVIAFKPARLKISMLAWWLGSVMGFGTMVLIFDTIFYGHPTKTGYANGEITFALSAIIPNLKHMPELLVRSVPALVLAGAGLVWMIVRLVKTRLADADPARSDRARRDALVGLFLALGWLGLWSLYMAYTWTAQMNGGALGGALHQVAGHLPHGLHLPSGVHLGGAPGGGGDAIHLIRFYVPAIGLIALLATWLVMQLPRWVGWVLAAGAIVTADASFHTLVAGGGMGAGFPGGGIPGLHGGTGRGTFPGGAGGGMLPKGFTPPSGFTPPAGFKPPAGFTPPSGMSGQGPH
jgi:hypothetical protein